MMMIADKGEETTTRRTIVEEDLATTKSGRLRFRLRHVNSIPLDVVFLLLVLLLEALRSLLRTTDLVVIATIIRLLTDVTTTTIIDLPRRPTEKMTPQLHTTIETTIGDVIDEMMHVLLLPLVQNKDRHRSDVEIANVVESVTEVKAEVTGGFVAEVKEALPLLLRQHLRRRHLRVGSL